MRFAYADPPYPGQSRRRYRNHPDYAGEVDHAGLIGRLCREYPDGWALSTSMHALRDVLGMCPAAVRIAAWHVTNAENNAIKHGGWHLAWEPLIVCGGRPRSEPIYNLLSCSNRSGALGAQIPGQKPPAFCRWMFGLLGAEAGDELDDLFAGSGAVAREWDAYQASPWLPALPGHGDGGHAAERLGRRLQRAGVPDLFRAAGKSGGRS